MPGPGPGPGSCTTPTCIGPYPCHVRPGQLQSSVPRSGYSTLQSHHRNSGYSLLNQDSCCTPRFNLSENYATLRRGLYPTNVAVNFNKSEFGHTKAPQISPSSFTGAGAGISTSSSVVSSELNHSVTTSDTSDVSSERDRESEV